MKSKHLFVAASFSMMFLAAGRAASKPAPATQDSEQPAAAAKADAKADARAAKAAAKAAHPAPAGSPLAKITTGMADRDVRRILGEPDDTKTYETGKRFIPGYSAIGKDQHRTEYIYNGQGRITLTRNEYTGSLKVIRVDYDPGI